MVWEFSCIFGEQQTKKLPANMLNHEPHFHAPSKLLYAVSVINMAAGVAQKNTRRADRTVRASL